MLAESSDQIFTDVHTVLTDSPEITRDSLRVCDGETNTTHSQTEQDQKFKRQD